LRGGTGATDHPADQMYFLSAHWHSAMLASWQVFGKAPVAPTQNLVGLPGGGTQRLPNQKLC